MKRYLPAILAILVIFGGFLLARAVGSASDPVITLSYLNQKFNGEIDRRAAGLWKPLADKLAAEIAAKRNEALKAADKQELIRGIAVRYIEQSGGARRGFTTRFTDITLRKGDTVTGGAGTGLILRAGNAQVSGASGQSAVNVSAGSDVKAGTAVGRSQYYLLLAADGSGFTVTSDTATVAVDGSYRVTPGYVPQYFDLADALYAMKLFRGTPDGYELNRPANRLEALVMMIRLLGEEETALAYTGSSPFDDVPDWGKRYVAYAFSKGYTKGTSAKKFTPIDDAMPDQYMTFMLRALGYSEGAGGDFLWNGSLEYAIQLKLFSTGEISLIKNPFYRDQVVYLSYYSLTGRVKGGGSTLLNRLISGGSLSPEKATAAMSKVTRTRP